MMNRFLDYATGAQTRFPFLLAVTFLLVPLIAPAHAGTIVGNVYEDTNLNGAFDAGEGIGGVTLQVFEDDGDGFHTSADSQVFSNVLTGNDGLYNFSNLDPDTGYFVVQPDQVIAGGSYLETIGEICLPGHPALIIDDFSAQQVGVVSPVVATSVSSVSDSSILGGERDFAVSFVSGTAEAMLHSNPYGLTDVLEFDQSAGVIASAIVTWNGVDVPGGSAPGLGSIDLTNGGLNSGFELRLGIDAAGAGDTLTLLLHDAASQTSSATIPIPQTDGTATAGVSIPFTSFAGLASPTDVDEIQLLLGGQQQSIDMQLEYLGLLGPHVKNIPLTHTVPEPNLSGWLLLCGLLAIRNRKR